jgi:uncharacterized protein YbaR (Trm112 family)
VTPLRTLKAQYQAGANITSLLRVEAGVAVNTPEIIETAYDLQTGSYVDGLRDPQALAVRQAYASEIASVILEAGAPASLLEAGVGDTTTLSLVLTALGAPVPAWGFDLSWSRIHWARQWLARKGQERVALCVADLKSLPYSDAAFDVVYTSHSMEPNHGSEVPILIELLRVTRRLLVLVEPEPDFELATPQARARMELHGYVRGIPDILSGMGLERVTHRPSKTSINSLNPSGITIIRKESAGQEGSTSYVCPKTRSALVAKGNCLFSPESLCAYPLIDDIPYLRADRAIVASRFLETLP